MPQHVGLGFGCADGRFLKNAASGTFAFSDPFSFRHSQYSQYNQYNQHHHHHHHHDQRQNPPHVSRYRSLRGKSISSPGRNKTFDVFCDNNDDANSSGNGNSRSTTTSCDTSRDTGRNSSQDAAAEGSPTRRRSASSVVASKGPSKGGYYAAKECVDHRRRQQTTNSSIPPAGPAPTRTVIPLNPKSVNLPSPAPSTIRTNHKPLRGSRSLNFARFNQTAPPSPPPSPPPPTPPCPPPCSAPSTPPNNWGRQPDAPRTPVGTGSDASHRQDPGDDARWADEVARLEAETDRILAEQKKLDLARLQAQLAATASSKPEPKPKKSKLKPSRLILDKLPFFSRRNKPNAPGQPPTPKSAPAHINSTWTLPLPFVDEDPSSQIMSLREHGGVDAPASASNGGERRVTVRCLSSTINLPVTPDTCPVDIAYGTANLISHRINPATSIVFECYEQQGLERRLRRYESIRDVMNSWDRDQRNSLQVVSYDSPPDAADLELASVPKTADPPTGFTVQLYHSPRRGKWSKRWITLMESGQIFAAKRPDTKPTDKTSTILCHMSDFDIFTPAQGEVKRDIKAPKKFCFAVKSQQKSNLFPNGENFVHYFSTDDEALAQRFHQLVFGWRSWYLANKRLDTQTPKGSASVRRSATSAKYSPSTSRYTSSSYRDQPSGERTPPTVGELGPLIDMPRSNQPSDVFGRAASTRARKLTESPVKPKLWAPPPPVPQSSQGSSEFLAGGLLGDAYDRRKRAETSPTEAKREEGPFTEGPSLLNSLPKSPTSPLERSAEASSWFPSALEHSARARSQSRPSQYRPVTADTAYPGGPNASNPSESLRSRPSQRLGVGRAVKPPAGAPLINFATGGTTSSQPMPTRSTSRASASAMGGSTSGRPRSHSMAAARSSGQRYMSADQPPVPPLPFRSARRPGSGPMYQEPTRGRGGRPQEPLINRVK
ncbi:hypothetical protein ACO1O0_009015 [Amphichorda felina]